MSDAPQKPDWEGFGRDILEQWPVRDVDGAELFEAALSNGLIREIPGGFDPDNHIDTEGICPERGDPWYEYAFGNTRAIPSPDALIRAALEAAAVSIEILPEKGNAGPPQDNIDRLLDAQRRNDARSIRAIAADPEKRAEILKAAGERG